MLSLGLHWLLCTRRSWPSKHLSLFEKMTTWFQCFQTQCTCACVLNVCSHQRLEWSLYYSNNHLHGFLFLGQPATNWLSTSAALQLSLHTWWVGRQFAWSLSLLMPSKRQKNSLLFPILAIVLKGAFHDKWMSAHLVTIKWSLASSLGLPMCKHLVTISDALISIQQCVTIYISVKNSMGWVWCWYSGCSVHNSPVCPLVNHFLAGGMCHDWSS